MKIERIAVAVACAGILAGCATTAPPELVDARAAYQRVSKGPAAQAAPVETHVAGQALEKAEKSFKDNSDSYQTRDLAYVAQRKAEMAEAAASINLDQDSQTRAKDEYQSAQANRAAGDRRDLGQAREDLAASERRGEVTAGQLTNEQIARNAADQRTVAAQSERTAADQRTVTAQSERTAADQRTATAQSERTAADQRTAEAQSERTAADQRTVAAQSERTAADQRTAEAQSARVAADQRTIEAQTKLTEADRRTAEALADLASVRQGPYGMVITLPGNVLFDSGKATLRTEARVRLNQVADVLLGNHEREMTIEGHTDSIGAEAYNLNLSQRRADTVRNYFIKRGYHADRITARGHGETEPVSDNGTAEGRASNRRVEIVILRDTHASNP